MPRYLRGSGFVNRYRITGTLTTASPLHIGSGEATDGPADDEGNTHLITRIIKDHRGKPLIPGSALKGVMRHWLLDILTGLPGDWAATHDYTDPVVATLGQDERVQKVLDEFSWLELLFGTPYHGGKVEVWDARCTNASIPSTDTLIGWNADSLTYVDQSVAIDPETGTAAEHLLYAAEAVPPGVAFEVSICGQNLSDPELAMILLALQGFNSRIYPLMLGARNGRGYGLMSFAPGTVYRLTAADLPGWVAATIGAYGDGGAEGEAGYYALPELGAEEQREILSRAKAQFAPAQEA